MLCLVLAPGGSHSPGHSLTHSCVTFSCCLCCHKAVFCVSLFLSSSYKDTSPWIEGHPKSRMSSSQDP